MIKYIKKMISNYYLNKANELLKDLIEHYSFQAEYGIYPKNSMISDKIKMQESFVEFYIEIAKLFKVRGNK